ncbi:hypothetical protein [Paenibacillus sp. FSL R10-2734]|uniref:hypothetical protein n=1 Tax=Paenibacillus sp. FSL R10-2734 TaxID=2954691 RepID=UPI0030D6FB84
MTYKERLLLRLDEIGETLEKKEGALALLGLGSVGLETDRIDDFSDLDFFVIVSSGYGPRFIDQLDWLEDTYPLAYSFKNSDFGCKILFEDGIYGEYAVFEEQEIEGCIYSEGRIVWKKSFFKNESIVKPMKQAPSLRAETFEREVNEALTNLYVGLGRYARGEKLSAARFVEGHAVDRLLSVMHLLESEVDGFPDIFGNDRRFEARFPQFAIKLGEMMQGYNKVPESSIYILNYLEQIYPVNKRMSAEIRKLFQLCLEQG